MTTNKKRLKVDEVTDDQGRRRFHGAFTGGFSAGYYNTAGSAEGWAPSTFKSSRSSRAATTVQRAQDYMDADDGLFNNSLERSDEYDTFGNRASKNIATGAAAIAAGGIIPGEQAIAVMPRIVFKLMIYEIIFRTGSIRIYCC